MYHVKLRKTNRIRRKLSIRDKVLGTAQKPRLSVFRSNNYIYGQLIDDEKGVTLADVNKEAKEMAKNKKKSEAAFELGKLLAEKAKEKKISEAAFDRNGYKYQGRVKMFADGAREGGLKLWTIKKRIKHKQIN